MQEHGLSDADVAEKMGVRRQYINYVAIVGKCNFKTVASLALALGVSESELIEFEEI